MSDSNSERNPVEVLAEEFLERYRRGESPELTEYVSKHPQHADEIRELFPTLVDLERALPDTDDGTEAVDQAHHPQHIGDYSILREVGRGGMGVVYEALQQSLSRRVALKILTAQHEDDLGLERFRREARAAAQLHHTNIVPVFDVGQEGTTCYYAMQFIQGQTLDAVIQEMRFHVSTGGESAAFGLLAPSVAEPQPARASSTKLTSSTASIARDKQATTVVSNEPPPDPDEPMRGPTVAPRSPFPATSSTSDGDYRQYFRSVAQVGLQVCQALSYAHQRGVVHRDIKPSNLLLDTNGVVWMTDFGMAKTDAEPLTRTGDILGTLHYMAPERFQGKCDSRADIYAAGLTVYELLTLTRAFESDDRLQLMKLIAKHEPSGPRSLNPRIPRDLETIVLKAVDKEPQRRYASAADMADDFQAYLEDRPIRARRIGAGERFVRWTRRNPVLSGLSMLTAFLLLLAAVGATSTAVVLKESTDRAVEAERVAERRAGELLQQSYINWVNLAYLECRNDNVTRANEYLQNCPPEQRGWEWQFVESQCQVALQSIKESGHSVNCLQFSPDGQWIAIGTGNFLNRSGPPGDLIVRNVRSGEVKFIRHGLANGVTAVTFSPDGRWIASANGHVLTVWDAESGDALFSKNGDTHDLLCLSFSPDGQHIAGGFGRFNGSHVGYVQIWDASSGEPVGQRLAGMAGGVWDLAYHPDGSRIALTGEGRVRVWDIEQRTPIVDLVGGSGFIYSVAYHPDGKYIAAGGLDRAIRLWNADTGQLLNTYNGHTGFVRGIDFSADGQRMISASEDKSVRLWEVESASAIATFHGHRHFVNCVAFSGNGKTVASGSLDQTVKIWFASGDQQLVYKGHTQEGHVRALAFSPSGAWLASGSIRFPGPRGRLHVWDAQTGEQVVAFPQNVDEVSSIEFARDGRRLVAGHASGHVTVWEADTARLIHSSEAHIGEVADVAYSPDGAWIASVGVDRSLSIWDANDGTLIRAQIGHQDVISSVEFSPDGTIIATGSEDGTIRLWHAASGEQQREWKHPRGSVRSVAFSPDGKRLVSTGGVDHRQGDVLIWNLLDGRQLGSLPGHTDIVYDVDFSPDGTRFATASDDRTIKLWDSASGREVFTIRGHTGGVVSVEFSPDGQQLASGGVDRTVRVWSLQQPELMVRFQRDGVSEYETGRAHLAQQDWDAAMAAFSRASALGMHGADFHMDWATCLYRSSDPSFGQELDRAIESESEEILSQLSLALRLSEQGLHDRALNVIDRSLVKKPQNPQVLSALGRIRAAAGQPDPAQTAFQTAVENLDDSPGWWETGWWSTGPYPAELAASQSVESGNGPVPALGEKGGSVPDAADIVWIPRRKEGDGYLSLHSSWNDRVPTADYAVQQVYSDRARSVAFLVGADDGLRLWLNQELIFQQTRGSQAVLNHRAVAAELRPGWNTVIVKLVNRQGQHGFYFRISDHARDRCRGLMRADRLDAVVDVWEAATAREQGDKALLDLVGNVFARLGRWEEAVDVFDSLIKRQPTRNRNWVSLAPLLVHTQQHQRYQDYREELLATFGDATSSITAERTSKASLLMPVALEESALPRRLATEASIAGANHALAPYFWFARGMSEYRATDYSAAADSLDKSLAGNRARWPYLDIVIHMYLAMCQSQQGDASSAMASYRKADQIFAERLPAEGSSDFGGDWLDWLICDITRREAKRLLFQE